MYHTSPVEIKEISKYGTLGSCLCFSDDVYTMTSSETVYVYEADFNTIDVSELFDQEIIEIIGGYFEVSEASAERLLDGRANAFDFGGEGEDDWWLQGVRGNCAKAMGYDGVKDSDEQGTVYIIPMIGRESELKLIEKRG